MAKRDNGKKFWNFVGNLQGDKVVWMIVLLLILLSIVAIFSSTPLLAIQQHTTRTAIMKEQLLISLAGLFFIILCYNIRSQRFFRAVSKLGWGFSMLLLIFLHLPRRPWQPGRHQGPVYQRCLAFHLGIRVPGARI